MMDKLWRKLFLLSVRHMHWHVMSYTAGRARRRLIEGTLEVLVEYRDLRMATGYTREEIYIMLETVRKAEKAMGWKCPEPNL